MPLKHQHTRRPPRWVAALLVAAGVSFVVPAAAQAQTAKTLYERAQAKDASARKSPSTASLRSAAAAYELVVRSYPRSGYCDDALWFGAQSAMAAWDQFGQARDKTTATRLLKWLQKEYPASKWVRQVPSQLSQLSEAPRPAPAPAPAPVRPAAAASAPAAPVDPGTDATIRNISHSVLPGGDRITIELTREVLASSERITGPDRLYFDLPGTQYSASLSASIDRLAGTRVPVVRLGRQDATTSRVVLELAGSPGYSVFTLYQPYRIVIDLEGGNPPALPLPKATVSAVPQPGVEVALPPAPPAATSAGDYSLSRQLGLGVSRIVIDAGHGGHDPGARANGLEEADLVLDIAQRVKKLLETQPGTEVVLTRGDDTFVPLEERTAIANREGADLFLSIHANASRRTAAKGVETYFLNFATNADAEAVAARENAGSQTSMSRLPELVQQITLHDKVKESREFAKIIQTTMVRGMRTQNKATVDLGVKQAPFVVLIGARMPSVLAEISFITNKAEATLLKKDAYRQRIAQSLADAVLRYQASLKKVTTEPADTGGR